MCAEVRAYGGEGVGQASICPTPRPMKLLKRGVLMLTLSLTHFLAHHQVCPPGGNGAGRGRDAPRGVRGQVRPLSISIETSLTVCALK